MKNGRYQIVTSAWHVMHFSDLFNALADDADFFLIHNNHRNWESADFQAARPIPANASHVPYYEPGKYDMAILDLDQQCVNLDLGKSKMQAELRECITDIPRVIIQHGSPVYPEFLLKDEMTKPEAEEECRKITRQMVGTDPMVVNSHTAASDKEWGWGIPIWHGMDPGEWWDLPKEPRVFTALSPRGTDEYYNRDCMNRTSEVLNEKYGHLLWWAKNNIDTHTSTARYKDFLGRSLIYLDTSYRTPMNRARTEAMLSGCCVVQVKGAHDLDQPVEQGNGQEAGKLGDYMIQVDDDPNKIADLVADLIENRYDECIARGQEAKKMAIHTFSRERYRQDWLKLIKSVVK